VRLHYASEAGVWYDLYPYADAVPFRNRPTALPLDEFTAHAALREELEYGGTADAREPWSEFQGSFGSAAEWAAANNFRAVPGPSRWRLDRELLGTLHNLADRTAVAHSARAHVRSRGFGRAITHIARMDSRSVAQTILQAGEGGSFSQVLRSADTPECFKAAIRALRVSTAKVLGTDGSRARQRRISEAYRMHWGASAFWVTANHADTRNPMMALVYDGPDSEVRLDIPAPTLPSLAEMKRRLAADPVGQAVFYRAQQRIFCEVVLGCTFPGELHADGIAMSTYSSAGGVIGDICAFHGPEEEQGRGSMHAHFAVFVLQGHCEWILRRLRARAEEGTLKELVAEWTRKVLEVVASVQFDSVLEVQAAMDLAVPPRGDEYADAMKSAEAASAEAEDAPAGEDDPMNGGAEDGGGLQLPTARAGATVQQDPPTTGPPPP
jgi:hypothetical protein